MPKQEVQGYMVDSDGNKLKEHAGLWHFTEGQNAGIPGQPQAMYVAAKGVGESGKDILVVPGR
jgi:tRNA U34 2-thiouridine synthase MnmA/TrmU